MRGKPYIFLDTMVYMHYAFVDAIDFQKCLGLSEVTIVLPRITIQELDKHKNTHSSRKIRDRVAKRLRLIHGWVSSESRIVRPGVDLVYLPNRPQIDFAEYGLDAMWSDDQLLAHVLDFQRAHADADVYLVTQDTGPALSAHHLGVETKRLPDELKLAQEPDPLVQENRKLKEQLLKLQAAAPNPVLRLSAMADDTDFFKITLKRPSVSRDALDKGQVIATLREQYPKMYPPKPPRGAADAIALAMSRLSLTGAVPIGEYERYNRELDTFFASYGDFLDRLAAFKTQADRTLPLQMEIRNLGSAPAEDIDIYVHFPDGFAMYTDEDLPREPAPPCPPEKPRTALQMSMGLMIRGLKLPDLSAPDHVSPTFSLRRTDSYELREHFQRIKHGYLIRIKPVYVVFASYDEAASFCIHYTLTLGNIPEPAEGTLNIVIEKE